MTNKRVKKRMKYTPIAIALLLLSACSGDEVKSTLGLERSAPDEFKVVSRPPLSVPPEFTLRPPLPGEDEVAGLPSDKLTRSMITGTSAEFDNQLPTKADGSPVVPTAVVPVESGSAPTSAEAELLSKLGTDKADPSVRDKIHEDRITRQQTQEESWIDALNPLKSDKKEVINATEEAKKLKEDGKPTTGEHLVKEGDPKTSDSKQGDATKTN